MVVDLWEGEFGGLACHWQTKTPQPDPSERLLTPIFDCILKLVVLLLFFLTGVRLCRGSFSSKDPHS